jgi:hypothetical protein
LLETGSSLAGISNKRTGTETQYAVGQSTAQP